MPVSQMSSLVIMILRHFCFAEQEDFMSVAWISACPSVHQKSSNVYASSELVWEQPEMTCGKTRVLWCQDEQQGVNLLVIIDTVRTTSAIWSWDFSHQRSLVFSSNMNSVAWSVSNLQLACFATKWEARSLSRSFRVKTSVASSLLFLFTACCRPRNVYGRKCWPTKPQLLPHLSVRTEATTRSLTGGSATQTGAPAPLNRAEASRLTLTYSTTLNSTWAPIENKRQPNL